MGPAPTLPVKPLWARLGHRQRLQGLLNARRPEREPGIWFRLPMLKRDVAWRAVGFAYVGQMGTMRKTA
jgi:hypothetical protein